MSNDTKKNVDEEVGGIDPNAFDMQLLLMDAYLDLLNKDGISIVTGAKVDEAGGASEINVPYLPSGFQSINALMGLDQGATVDNIESFIKGITPQEMAQIYPKVNLFIVDSETDEQVEIPLAQAADITKADTSAGYYSTNQAGLKSFSMSLDGSDLPFFSKSYLVDLELVFDSINTFVSPVFGFFNPLSAIGATYADIFRSPGRVGTAAFYTKLSISYSSTNQDLIDKYSLTSPEMIFTMFLHLVKTNIKIDENLKVTVNVSYQSREESIFDSNLVFDFLGLQLDEYQRIQNRAIDTASKKLQSLQEARESYREQITEQTKGSERYKKLQDFIKSSPEARKKFEERTEKERMREVKASDTSKQQSNVKLIQDAQLLRAEEIRNNNLKDLGKEFQAFEKNVKSVKQELKRIESELSTENLNQTFNKIHPGKGGGTLDDDLKTEISKAKEAFANARHDELVKALEETFAFNSKEILEQGVIKTIYITSKQLQNYYDSSFSYQKGIKQQQKDLTNAKKATKKKQSLLPTTKEILALGDTTVKPKPTTSEKKEETSRFDQDTQTLLQDLGRAKQVDYILFGDIIRLVFRRLYAINAGQANKLSNNQTKAGDPARIFKAIQDSVMLFSDIELNTIKVQTEGASLTRTTKALYDFPISVRNLRYILARNLYGKQKNMFTVFDLIQELINLISLTRKRKAQILNIQKDVGNFQLKKMTYPLKQINSPVGGPTSGGATPYQSSIRSQSIDPRLYRIITNPFEKGTKNGMVIYVKRYKDFIPDPNSVLPEFIFGGSDRGIIKRFEINEIQDDDLQKLVMEQIRGGDGSIIPSFFEVGITTILAPIFQLGMQIKVNAPTIISAGLSGGAANTFINGDYQVSNVTHEYSAGSGFSTTIKATLYNADKQKALARAGLERSESGEDLFDFAKGELAGAQYKASISPSQQQKDNVVEGILKTTKPPAKKTSAGVDLSGKNEVVRPYR